MISALLFCRVFFWKMRSVNSWSSVAEINLTLLILTLACVFICGLAFLHGCSDVVEYLSQILEEGDAGELAAALGHIAKARGMTEIARVSGIKREALYKALRSNSHHRFDCQP